MDTPADLATVLELGAGRHTCALLRDLGLTCVASRLRPDQPGRFTRTGSVQDMQGTVATFDPDTHSGTLLLDDGTELAFAAPTRSAAPGCGCCASGSGSPSRRSRRARSTGWRSPESSKLIKM